MGFHTYPVTGRVLHPHPRGALDSPHAPQYAHVMDSTLACLVEWMPRQRWYTSKGRSPLLRLLAARDLVSPDPAARVRILILADDAVQPAVVYQVPLVLRAGHVADAPGVIGRTSDDVTLLDGPTDAAFTSALWSALDTAIAEPDGARVLAGEQSNTSVVFGSEGGDPVICKLFRQLHAGINPDIELQSALAAAGSRHVPRAIGQLDATWSDPLGGDQPVTGSLAFAQDFLPGVDDAWRVALRAAADGASFTGPAHALGAATADVHVRLASLLPTADADERARAAVEVAWERRLGIAIAEVPALARHRDAIAAVYAQALQTRWQPLQRIHGDYHLGQVLHAPGRGWVLLDFEGEPMRPIAERRQPDSVLRDVAGMLRSFDYVAGSLQRAGTPAPEGWAAEARQAFLGGYEGRSGHPATGPLLDAFELDKAVYEAIYETRNRPDWLAIPLAAIDRLVIRL